jgi:type II secretory pathway component PulL
MARKTFILFAGDASWKAAASGARAIEFKASTVEQIATEAATALEQLGYGAGPVILAIPSSWCLAATIKTDDLAKGDAKALTYRLEEKIPWAAESVVADFVRHEGMALGVCVKIERVRGLIEALEKEGIAIQTVTPAALLAAQGVEAPAGVLILKSHEQTDLFLIPDGRPSAWALADDEEDVATQLKLLTMEGEAQLEHVVREDVEELAMRGAEAISGGRQAWIDLRRGELAAPDTLRLHRRGINALLAGAAVFLVAVCGVFFWRAHQYQQRTEASRRQMGEAFVAQYPAWDVPGNVKAVIESEHRRLVGAPSAGLPAEMNQSALETMYAVLKQLPADSGLNIQRLTCNADSVDIEGQLRSYEEADVIAGAARKAGLQVPPPQVRKEGSGLWTITLHATRDKPVAMGQRAEERN